MINKLLGVIKDMDRFGAVFRPQLKGKQSEYKTFIGGLTSILLYGLSLSYFIYAFFQWGTGAILPRVTYISEILDYEVYNHPGSILEFQTRKVNESSIDPFDPKAIILHPIIIKFVNGVPSGYESRKVFKMIQPNISRGYVVEFGNVTFHQSIAQTVDQPQIDYFIAFTRCQPQLLEEGTQCADDALRKKYINQAANAIRIYSNTYQFNTAAQRIEQISSENFLLLDFGVASLSSNILHLQRTESDTGLLFEEITEYLYVASTEVRIQQVSKEYLMQAFGFEIFMLFSFRVDTLLEVQNVQFTKIAEVLADSGSIVSLMLLSSYCIVFLNELQLEEDLANSIIKIYYPEFCHIKFIKNWCGRIVRVYYETEEQDAERFLNYYRKLKDIACAKLCLNNQIYEISRLQFILQAIAPGSRVHFLQAHKMGIKLSKFPVHKQQLDDSDQGQLSQLSQHINQISDQLSFQRQQVVPQEILHHPFTRNNEDNHRLREIQREEVALKNPEMIRRSKTSIDSQAQYNTIDGPKALQDQDFQLLAQRMFEVQGFENNELISNQSPV